MAMSHPAATAGSHRRHWWNGLPASRRTGTNTDPCARYSSAERSRPKRVRWRPGPTPTGSAVKTRTSERRSSSAMSPEPLPPSRCGAIKCGRRMGRIVIESAFAFRCRRDTATTPGGMQIKRASTALGGGQEGYSRQTLAPIRKSRTREFGLNAVDRGAGARCQIAPEKASMLWRSDSASPGTATWVQGPMVIRTSRPACWASVKSRSCQGRKMSYQPPTITVGGSFALPRHSRWRPTTGRPARRDPSNPATRKHPPA